MAQPSYEYSARGVLVGRHFLSVPRTDCPRTLSDVALWRSGVVRATNSVETQNVDFDNLQLLLEYSDVDWAKREWVSANEQTATLYVEDRLVWGRRPPETGHRENKDIRWPTVLYRSMLDERQLVGGGKPGVFMGDGHRMIFTLKDVKEFRETEIESCFLKMAAFSAPLLEWRRAEKTRELLISGKFDLRGQRVRVYRTEVTQWFTASVVDQDLNTKTLTVLEDTILQMRHPHPAQVEVHLLELDGILPEFSRLATVSAFRPVVRRRHHAYHPGSGTPSLALSEVDVGDLSIWKRRLRQHTPPIPVHSITAPMSTRMVADYAKNGVTWDVRTHCALSIIPITSPPSTPSVSSPVPPSVSSSPLFQSQHVSNIMEQQIEVTSPVSTNSRMTGERQFLTSSSYPSVKLNSSPTHPMACHLHSLSSRTKSTSTIQKNRQHQHRSLKSRSKPHQSSKVSSSKTILAVGKPRDTEEADVAGVLASMAALTSLSNTSNLTTQSRNTTQSRAITESRATTQSDATMQSRAVVQTVDVAQPRVNHHQFHSVKTILGNEPEGNSVNQLGNFFEAVVACRSEPPLSSMTTFPTKDSAAVRDDISVSMPNHLSNRLDPLPSSLLYRHRQEALHHAATPLLLELDGETRRHPTPRKKSSPLKCSPSASSPPIRSPTCQVNMQTSTRPSQLAASPAAEVSTCQIETRKENHVPVPSTTSETVEATSRQLESSERVSMASLKLSSSSVAFPSPPHRHIDSPSRGAHEEMSQSAAKRKKVVRGDGTENDVVSITPLSHVTIPPLIMADPEAARIKTVSANPVGMSSTSVHSVVKDVQPASTDGSETTNQVGPHTCLLSQGFRNVNTDSWLSAGSRADGVCCDVVTPACGMRANALEDNVIRFQRRYSKFKRATKECVRLLEATRTAETETGRYVWLGSVQGMRLIIDATDRLARNLQGVKALLQESVDAVCSSHVAVERGILLPPLPPVTEITPVEPSLFSSNVHLVSSVPASTSSSFVSIQSSMNPTSDQWVGLTPDAQGKNMIGELSVDIDKLAMLIRTPRLRSAEKEDSNSNGSKSGTPKRYVLGTKGMVESVTPSKNKKATLQKASCDVDKLIQWPKHVTGVSDDDGQRTKSKPGNVVRRRLTSDLGPNWKLERMDGQKRATSQNAQAKIRLVSEIDHMGEDGEFDVDKEVGKLRPSSNELLPRRNSTTSICSDSTVIDDAPAAKSQEADEQRASVNLDESASNEQSQTSVPDTVDTKKPTMSKSVASTKKQGDYYKVLCPVTAESCLNINSVKEPERVRIDSEVTMTKVKPARPMDGNQTKDASDTVKKSRKRQRESGKKDRKKAAAQEKQGGDGQGKVKRPVGRPPFVHRDGQAGVKKRSGSGKNNKSRSVGKSGRGRPANSAKQASKKVKKVAAENGSDSVVSLSTRMEVELEKSSEYAVSLDDGCRPRLPRVAKSRECSGLQTGTCTQQRLLQSCMDCVKALRRGTGLRGERWCRFIHFRKLKRDEEGHWLCDGFANPFSVSSEDMEPYLFNGAENLDKETASYIISCILPTFCDLVAEEESVLKRRGKKSAVAWKRAFVGIRELCDVCVTTIFNVHWFCEYCGFVVCIDCHRLRNRRENGLFHKCHIKYRVENGKDEILKVAQTFPKTVLCDLSTRVHEVCNLLKIEMVRTCRCEKDSQSGDTSGGSLKLGKKGRRQSKNSQSETKADSVSENGETLVNGDVQKRALDTRPSENGVIIVVETPESAVVVEEVATEPAAYAAYPQLPVDVPHLWLCDGKLLLLLKPQHVNNLKAFHFCWRMGKPVVVAKVNTMMSPDLWTPQSFGRDFGKDHCDMVNCRSGYIIEDLPIGQFWNGFEDLSARMVDDQGKPMLLKLKDWPHSDDLSDMMPNRFEDFMENVPLPEYTRRDGRLNLAARLPDRIVKPDLGPKMYNAYGSAAYPKEGTTNLHLDMSDAVNVMVYVGIPRSSESSVDESGCCQEEINAAAAAIEECDELTHERLRNDLSAKVGALWHIFAAEDAPKIRQLLLKVSRERGMECEADNDPIHDQCFYLDKELRERLRKEYGVEGWAIAQCLGDAIFIPAGAPHQVRNLHSCIKIAEDFVSPEHLAHCLMLTHEFRRLSDTHTNHEDKLQIKNIIYHSVKDSVGVLLSER